MLITIAGLWTSSDGKSFPWGELKRDDFQCKNLQICFGNISEIFGSRNSFVISYSVTGELKYKIIVLY